MADPVSLSSDTVISVGAAIVVVGFAIRAAMAFSKIESTVKEIRRGMLDRRDFEVWKARLAQHNPTLHIPDVESDEQERE